MDESPPAALVNWIFSEQEYCFSATQYGKTLLEEWVRGAPDFARDLEQELGGDGARSDGHIIHSLRETFGLPGYQGIVDLCLSTVQRLDQEHEGRAIDKIVSTTLATNDRYAAVYAPRVAPDWSVIAFDWGTICGLWNVAVCFGRILESADLHEWDDVIQLCLDSEKLQGCATNTKNIGAHVAQALMPSILAGQEPPVPLTYEDGWKQGRMTSALFHLMIFSLVAHEYAHLRLGHPAVKNPDLKQRHEMEHEADTMALAYILANPWGDEGDPNNPAPLILGVAAHSLVLSYIGMLETADEMIRDIHGTDRTKGTHPPADVRQWISDHYLKQILEDEDVLKFVTTVRHSMTAMINEAWNHAVPIIVSVLESQALDKAPDSAIAPRDAELSFY